MYDLALVSLVINGFTFGVCSWLAYRSFKRDNLIGLLFWSVFIFLVCGQAIHISVRLLELPRVRYLWNYISREGHCAGSLCLLVMVAVATFISLSCSCRRVIRNRTPDDAIPPPTYTGHMLFIVVNGIVLSLMMGMLIQLGGGLNAVLNSSRVVVGGSTFFLIGLSAAVYPLVYVVVSGGRTSFGHVALFIVAVVSILFFSRLLAMFHVLLLLCASYYSLGRTQGLLAYRSRLLVGGGLLFIMFFVFGTYKHVLPMVGTSDPFVVAHYLFDHPEVGLLSLGKNYEIGIEGMTGLSGALTLLCEEGEAGANWGSSLIGAVFQLVPSVFRGYLGDVPSTINGLYWYHGSVVAGGLEGFYVHFSFLGFPFYAMVFCVYALGIHNAIQREREAQHPNVRKILVYLVLAVYGLELIRGATRDWIFFTVTGLAVLKLSFLLRDVLLKPKLPEHDVPVSSSQAEV